MKTTKIKLEDLTLPIRTNGESTATPPQDIQGSYVTPDGKAQIDFGIAYRNGYPEFTASGHFNGASGQCLEDIAAAYPKDATVMYLDDTHSIHHLKQVTPSHVEEIKALADKHPTRDFYQTQADTFLVANGLKLRATLANSKPAPRSKEDGESGNHYRVTISAKDTAKWGRSKLVFDFWGSIADAQCLCCKGKGTVKGSPLPSLTHEGKGFWIKDQSQRSYTCPECSGSKRAKEPKAPTAYDVLACISPDACFDHETFADFCDEFGYDSDSLTALQTFNRCKAFAKRLQAFFTPAELDQLAEIR